MKTYNLVVDGDVVATFTHELDVHHCYTCISALCASSKVEIVESFVEERK